jgi:hypothetical protein
MLAAAGSLASLTAAPCSSPRAIASSVSALWVSLTARKAAQIASRFCSSVMGTPYTIVREPTPAREDLRHVELLPRRGLTGDADWSPTGELR